MKFFMQYILLFILGSSACSPIDPTGGGRDSGPKNFTIERDAGRANFSKQNWKSPEPSNHRVRADACDNTRPSLPVVMIQNPNAPCREHSDCVDGANGRCSYYPGPGNEASELYCTYDVCFRDDDCEPDELCSCGQDIHANNRLITDQNRCVPANCKTDADCPRGYCKASPSECGDGVILGYFCTNDEDECRDNIDCGRSVCTFPFYYDYEGADRFVCIGSDCD